MTRHAVLGLAAAVLLAGCTNAQSSQALKASSPTGQAPMASTSAPTTLPPTAAAATAAASTPPPDESTTPAAPNVGASPRSSTLHARVIGHLPVPLSRMGVVVVGGRILSLGGLLNSGSSDAVYAFDPATGSTSRRGALVSAVHDTAAAVVGDRTLVFGGGAATESRAVQAVDAHGRTRTWGSLPEPRSDLVVVPVGATAYVIGGYTGTRELAAVLATTDGRTFRRVGRLPVSVRYAAVTVVGTDIWVIGGDHSRTPTDAVQRIDTTTGRVTLVGHLMHPLGHASAWTTATGQIIVAGGSPTNSSHSDAIAHLDTHTLRLTRIATLPRPTSDMGVVHVGTAVYLVGGESAHRIDSIVRVSG